MIPISMGMPTLHQDITRNYLMSDTDMYGNRFKNWLCCVDSTIVTVLLLHMQVLDKQLVVQWSSFLVALECNTDKLTEARARDILSLLSE